MADIHTYRLPAKPRNKRLRYAGWGSSGASAIGISPVQPTFWRLVTSEEGERLEFPYIRSEYDAVIGRLGGYLQIGETRLSENPENHTLTLLGADGGHRHFHSTGDVVAYADSDWEETFPIAGMGTLGLIKLDSQSNATILPDGTLRVTGGSGGLSSITESGGGNAYTGFAYNNNNLTLIKGNTFALNSALTAHTSNSAIHVTATERTNWNTAYTQAHTHHNADLLDGITNTEIARWNMAYSRSHTHTNEAVLNGITATNVTNWNTAYTRITTGTWWGQHMNASGIVSGAISNTGAITPASSNASDIGSASLRYRSLFINNIEIYGANPYIDFHFNNSTADYTSRLYEVSSGRLYIPGGFSVGGNVGIGTTSPSHKLHVSGGDIVGTGDVVAYQGGGGTPAPFMYWRPTVDTQGNISWANTISETVPAAQNIKGPKGDDGAIRQVRYDASGSPATYTSGIRIITGYIELKPTTPPIAANGIYTEFLWDCTISNTLSVTASVNSIETNTWAGHQLVCNVGRAPAAHVYRITLYNPTNAAISLSNLRLNYIAVMLT